jgi:hypothetical protein
MFKRIPRTRGVISGLIVLLLGIWGGLIPFVGPYFSYAMHTNQHWHWFADRGWLEVLPGGVAVIGGLIMLRGGTRASISLGAMLGLAAGLWFLAGPTVSTLWNNGAVTVGPPMGAHKLTRALEWIGFFYGTGALLTLFSSYALGFIAALPVVDERVVGTAAGTSPGRRRWRAPSATPAPPPAAAPTQVRPANGTEARPATTGGRASSPSRRFFRRRRTTTSA